jgi:DNA polymerase-3 subunit beta
MKLKANAGGLAGALALAGLALETRVVIAILGCVHIKAGTDGVTHFAVNVLDRAITVTAKAEVTEPGETVVRAAALAGLVNGFPKDGTVEINSDTEGATVRCGRARYRLPVLPIDQLPPAPVIDVVVGEIELDRKELLAAIKQVVFAASTEETRYYLNGLLLHDEGDRLVLVATDAYRLAKRQLTSAPFSVDHSCIVPLRTIAPLIKLLGKTTAEEVRLRRSKALLEVSAPSFVLVSKLIDASYPDYARIIPKCPTNSATVDRTDLVAALVRLNAVSEHGEKLAALVGLAWEPAKPVLRLSLPNQPDAADDAIAATITGAASIWTAAQIAHIAELVDQIHNRNIRIATDGAGGAILVTDPDDDNLLVIQMPVHIARGQSRAA